MIGRYVMPIHSPLSPAVLYRSAADTVWRKTDPVARVQRLLQSVYAADDALLVDSGTHALDLALRLAMGHVGGPPHIALPAYSCFDVATAAVGAGATQLTLFDIDPETLAPDLASLERALQAGARVIVITPLYGMPVDWEAIERCATPYGAVVVEDAAQGHGGTWRDRPLGSHGRLSVLSFGRGKGWTGGCGGAVLARRGMSEAFGPLRAFAPPPPAAFTGFARAGVQWALARSSLYALPASCPWLHLGETRYHAPSAPRGVSRVAAGMIAGSFPLAADESAHRRAHAQRIIAGLAGLLLARPALAVRPIRPSADGTPGYLRFPLLLRGGMAALPNRRQAMRLGIMSGYPAALATLPSVRERLVPAGATAPQWPGAEMLVRDLVTLATHSRVTAMDLEGQLYCLRQSGHNS